MLKINFFRKKLKKSKKSLTNYVDMCIMILTNR